MNNQRIGFDVNGTHTWTVWDRGNPYADFNSSGTLQYVYLYGQGLDTLLARFDGTTAMFYLTDALGSVRQDVYVSGTVVDAITYGGFGNILTETSPSGGDRFKYTAREYDSATGLQYNRARYYNSADGRWISQDPSGLRAGDPNLFRYVVNAPVCHTDPTGLWDWRWAAGGAVAGAVIGGLVVVAAAPVSVPVGIVIVAGGIIGGGIGGGTMRSVNGVVGGSLTGATIAYGAAYKGAQAMRWLANGGLLRMFVKGGGGAASAAAAAAAKLAQLQQRLAEKQRLLEWFEEQIVNVPQGTGLDQVFTRRILALQAEIEGLQTAIQELTGQ